MSNNAMPMIYEAMENSTLTVWVLVGDGQLASVALDGQLGNADGRGNFRWPFGLAEALIGKTLTVDATIQDVNPLTNRSSLTFVLYQVAEGMPDIPRNRRNLEFFPSRAFELPPDGNKQFQTLLKII